MPDVFVLLMAFMGGLLALMGYMLYRTKLIGLGIWVLRKFTLDETQKQKQRQREQAILHGYDNQYSYVELDDLEPIVTH